ncbi:MAG: glycosyltransferase family 4 protein [Acidimicrobiales bacterium]
MGRGTGGAELVAFALSENLTASGDEVVLISDVDQSLIDDAPPGLRVERVDTHRGWGRVVKLVPFEFPRWLLQHLVGNVRAARLAGQILARDEEGFDVVHLHGALATILLRHRLRLSRLDVPLVYTEHDSTPWSCHYRGRLEAQVRRVIYRQLNLRACRRASAVVINFPSFARELSERSGMPESHFVTVRNGVRAPATPTGPTHVVAVPRANRYLLFVGSLIERKGPDVLIRALSSVDLGCVFIGDGPMRASLERLAAREGVSDRVVFLGAVDPSEVQRYYGGAEALVLPSVSEGVPLVAVEALRAGTPVVASNLEGIASVVRDRDNGLLVEPGDEESLAGALALLESDERLARSLRRGATRSARNVLTWSAVAGHLRVVYEGYRPAAGALSA